MLNNPGHTMSFCHALRHNVLLVPRQNHGAALLEISIHLRLCPDGELLRLLLQYLIHVDGPQSKED